MSTCRFCELRSDPGAHYFGSVYILRDGYQVTPGHQLVIPFRHRSDYFEMSVEELRDTEAALRFLRLEWTAEGAAGFNIGWNCGAAAGQTVPHAHCHFIPRRLGDVADPTGGVRGVIPGRQRPAACAP